MGGLNLYQLSKKILHCAEAASVSSLILVLASTNAYAMPKDFNNDKLEFAGLKPVADEELSSMRGGFRFSNGLTLDFALKVQAAVDGGIVHTLDVIGNHAKDVKPEDFRTVIQVGEGNKADIPNTTKIKVGGGGSYTQEYRDGDRFSSYRPTKENDSDYVASPEVAVAETTEAPDYGRNFSHNGKSFTPGAITGASVPTMSDLQSVVRNAGATNLPGVLTVIQNTLDNKVIQTLNILDINVSNLSKYKMQELTSQLNNPALNGL